MPCRCGMAPKITTRNEPSEDNQIYLSSLLWSEINWCVYAKRIGVCVYSNPIQPKLPPNRRTSTPFSISVQTTDALIWTFSSPRPVITGIHLRKKSRFLSTINLLPQYTPRMWTTQQRQVGNAGAMQVVSRLWATPPTTFITWSNSCQNPSMYYP